MIRGNYSLAAEFKKNESKQQQKIQQRQRHQHQLDKLSSVDPIRLYKQIQYLEQRSDRTESENKRLKNLKSDWDFIIKKKLHTSVIEPFLKKIKQEESDKLRADRKLWGSKSVYFNSELNPLGKVPQNENLGVDLVRPLPNHCKPLKNHLVTKYEKDPVIDSLGVVLPPGEPPRFFKEVFNIENAKTEKRSADPDTHKPVSIRQRRGFHGDDDSDNSEGANSSDDDAGYDDAFSKQSHLAPEEAAYIAKKQRF